MPKKELLHLTYLVKLWQVRSQGQVVWHGSMEDAHTGEKKGFGDPAHLFDFLQEKLGLKPSQPKADDPVVSGPADHLK